MNKYIDRGRLLGGGASGAVYECVNKETGEMVAMKYISFDDKDQPIPSNILREVSILKDMRHPNIIRIYDVFADPRKVQIVTEKLDDNLKNFIEETDMSLNLIKKFLRQILEGLCHMHACKIVHRDLSPANILVDKEMEIVKIGDFGLAREINSPLDTLTKTGQTCFYMDPERQLNCGGYSTPVDIFAVGCIFAEMVLKEPLFFEDCQVTQINVMRKLLCSGTNVTMEILKPYRMGKVLTDLFPKIGVVGEDLFWKLLSWDPSKRINADQALKHSFFH